MRQAITDIKHRPRLVARVRHFHLPIWVLTVAALSLTLSATAAASAPVAPTPVNTGAPALTGTPAPGQTLTCSAGAWSNNPTSFAYAWLRDGSPIAGQTGSTYVVQNADRGHSISCRVTADNEGGGYTISSLPSGSYKVSFSTESEGGNYLKQFFNGKSAAGEADPVAVAAPNATGGIGAQLHAGGQIAGRVIDVASKAAIAGVLVCAEQMGSKPEFGGCETTNGNGEYAIGGLGTGSYDVAFYSFALSTAYRQQFYNGKANYGEADPVAVTTGATTSGINAELRPYNEGSAIKGVVTNAKTHAGIQGIEVCATPANEIFVGACAKTGPSGEYTIGGLGEAEYVVTFSGVSCTSTGCTSLNVVPQYYKEVYEYSKGTKVSLKANETRSSISVEMIEGGEIKGVVTDAAGSKEDLAGVQVCADGSIKIGAETGFFDDCATTGATGEYVLAGLPTGSYTIRFSTVTANYLEDVTTGSATDGATTTVNAELQRGGQVAGRVTDAATHTAVAGVGVCSQGPSNVCTTTGAGGEYTLSRLQPGTYEVSYFVEESEKLNYLPQTRGGVAVNQGETTGGIDAELSPGGQITGRVTDAVTHAGLPHISVCAEEIGAGKAFQCASTARPGASAAATSSSLAVPAPNSAFKMAKKPRFNAKTGNLEFFFVVSNPGTFKWSLFFKNSDVGFADSLGISLGEGEAVAETAKRKGKKGARCKTGFVKHKHRCVRVNIPFGSGSKKVPAGTVKILVHASGKALKALKAGHTLHVSGKFTFQSALGGAPVTHSESAVVRLPKKKGKKRHKK